MEKEKIRKILDFLVQKDVNNGIWIHKESLKKQIICI